MFWAASSKAVMAKRQRVLGSLVFSKQQVQVDDERALPVLLKVGLRFSSWHDSAAAVTAAAALACELVLNCAFVVMLPKLHTLSCALSINDV